MKLIERIERLQLILNATKSSLEKGRSPALHAILRNAAILGSNKSTAQEKAQATSTLNGLINSNIQTSEQASKVRTKRVKTPEEIEEIRQTHTEKLINAVRSKDALGIERASKNLRSIGMSSADINHVYNKAALLIPQKQDEAMASLATQIGGEAGERIKQGYEGVKAGTPTPAPKQKAVVQTPESAPVSAASPTKIAPPWVTELGHTAEDFHQWSPSEQQAAQNLHMHLKRNGKL